MMKKLARSSTILTNRWVIAGVMTACAAANIYIAATGQNYLAGVLDGFVAGLCVSMAVVSLAQPALMTTWGDAEMAMHSAALRQSLEAALADFKNEHPEVHVEGGPTLQ